MKEFIFCKRVKLNFHGDRVLTFKNSISGTVSSRSFMVYEHKSEFNSLDNV
jgi:hypothetical protein